ncbi:phage tail tube protein [Anatilimnocola floriformis]|uniref:phage tail tube protein n=1 Tax=Anatilimnocola floriformis TaxID=2948575 RepID=UPI0020C26E9B|nr:phage tail tube protein [Anatilimnocola floriformis]
MSLLDRIGLGATFAFSAADPEDDDIVLSIVDPGISGSSSKATAATSRLGDAHDTFLGGSVDPGEVTFTVAFHPGSATELALDAWYAANGQASVRTCTITLPELGDLPEFASTGDGILTSRNNTINRNELVTEELTIKRSGAWVTAEVEGASVPDESPEEGA